MRVDLRPRKKAKVSCQMIWLDKAKAVVNNWKGSLATLQNVVTSSGHRLALSAPQQL